MAARLGDFDAAYAFCEELGTNAHKSGLSENIKSAVYCVGVVTWIEGKLDLARQKYEEGLALSREQDEDIARKLRLLANLCKQQRDYMAACIYAEECISLCRQTNSEVLPNALNVRGSIACHQSDNHLAHRCFKESALFCQKSGNKEDIAETLEGFVQLAAFQKQTSHAARLMGAAEAIRKEIVVALNPVEAAVWNGYIAPMREELGEEAFAAAWAAGRAMTMEQAIAYALNETEVRGETQDSQV